jgi:hypothetical protein
MSTSCQGKRILFFRKPSGNVECRPGQISFKDFPDFWPGRHSTFPDGLRKTKGSGDVTRFLAWSTFDIPRRFTENKRLWPRNLDFLLVDIRHSQTVYGKKRLIPQASVLAWSTFDIPRRFTEKRLCPRNQDCRHPVALCSPCPSMQQSTNNIVRNRCHAQEFR